MHSFTNRFNSTFEFCARLSFALTIILTPFRWRLVVWSRPHDPLYSDYTDFHLFASDIALLIMLLFWLGSLILHPRKILVGHWLIWVSLLGLTVAGWVSILGSADPVLSAYHALRFVILLLFYLYIVNEIHLAQWVVIPVTIQVVIQSVIAIGQSLSQSSLGLGLLGEHTLDPNQSGISIVSVAGMRFLRAYGLSDHPNILGGCLVFGLILLLAVVLHGTKRQAYFASAGFLIAVVALVATFSRSAWLSLMVAASFLVVGEALARRWDSVNRVVWLAAASLLVVSPFLLQNLGAFEARANAGNVTQDDQMQERGYLLDAGNTLFVEHPMFGVGLGATALALKDRFETFRLDYQPPHFTLLAVVVEVGLTGGVFYFLLLAVPALVFLFRWQEIFNQPYLMGAMALLVGLFVVGLFDYYPWSYAPGRLWQWLAWGLFSVGTRKMA